MGFPFVMTFSLLAGLVGLGVCVKCINNNEGRMSDIDVYAHYANVQQEEYARNRRRDKNNSSNEESESDIDQEPNMIDMQEIPNTNNPMECLNRDLEEDDELR